MIIATYIDGRNLEYDESLYAFSIGGTPVSISDVRAWDAAGQIQWGAPAQKEWFDALNEQDFELAHENAVKAAGVAAPVAQTGVSTQPLPQNSYYPQQQSYPGNTGYGYQGPQGSYQPYGQGTYAGYAPPQNGIPQAQPAVPVKQSSTGKTVAIVIGVVVCVLALCTCCCCSSIFFIDAVDSENDYTSSSYVYPDSSYSYDYGDDFDFDYGSEYPDFTSFETSGSNGDVVKIPSGATQGLLELVSYDGSDTPIAYFVDSVDHSESGRYGTLVGTSYISFENNEYLKIQSDGNWTVRYKPINDAVALSGGSASGNGDMVYSYNTSLDENWLFTLAEGDFDAEVYTSEGYDEIYLSTAPGSDSINVPAGEGYLVIITDGSWTLAKSTV